MLHGLPALTFEGLYMKPEERVRAMRTGYIRGLDAAVNEDLKDREDMITFATKTVSSTMFVLRGRSEQRETLVADENIAIYRYLEVHDNLRLRFGPPGAGGQGPRGWSAIRAGPGKKGVTVQFTYTHLVLDL